MGYPQRAPMRMAITTYPTGLRHGWAWIRDTAQAQVLACNIV